FGPNSAHPYENPSPWSNLIEVVSIIIIPMASIVMFGRMIKDRGHALVIYGAMMALLLAGVVLAIHAEMQPSAAIPGLPVERAGRQHGGQGGAARADCIGDLGGGHDGHIQRFRERDARQFSGAGRAGAHVANDA